MVWTAPRTWTVLQTPTAAIFNLDVRDNLKAIGDAWTAYTPVWTGATTNPVLNDGTLVGKYIEAGKLVHFWIHLTMGPATTYGSGSWLITLPVLESSVPSWSFSGIAADTSAGTQYPIFGVQGATGAGSMRMQRLPTTAGNQFSGVAATTPFTWASTDVLSVHGTYEAA